MARRQVELIDQPGGVVRHIENALADVDSSAEALLQQQTGAWRWLPLRFSTQADIAVVESDHFEAAFREPWVQQLAMASRAAQIC